MTAWDRLLFRRAAALSLVLLAAAFGVLVATDEPTSGLGDRVARLAALSPVLAALAVTVLAGALERTGELRALAAAGASPLRALRGLALGAATVALALTASLASGLGSLGALFPRLEAPPWRAVGSGFRASAAGVSLDRGGAILFEVAAATAGPSPSPPRALVALTLALAGASLPLWAALPAARGPRLVVAAAAVLSAIVAFHAVAAGAAAGWLLAPLALPWTHAAFLLAGFPRPRGRSLFPNHLP